MQLKQFQDQLAKDLFGETKEESNKAGHCIQCKESFQLGVNVFTDAGKKECSISGMCEKCFDTLFE